MEQLIAAARNGCQDSLGRLFEQSHDYLRIAASEELQSNMRRRVSASDVVQEAMLEATRDFGEFQGNAGAEFRVWLRQILRNTMIDMYRRHVVAARRSLAREQAVSGASGTPIERNMRGHERSPSSLVAANEETARLREGLERLPDEYREVLFLRNLQSQSFVEIGHVMGRTANGARKLWLRALTQLAKELGSTPPTAQQHDGPQPDSSTA